MASTVFAGLQEALCGVLCWVYQVCEKWLKDRRGRELSYDDIEDYQKITVGLGRTIMCMGGVDEIIDGYGGWPMK